MKYFGRRILCDKMFKLNLATVPYLTNQPKFGASIASMLTLVNYSSSNESLFDELLTRAFSMIRCELYKDYGFYSLIAYLRCYIS